MSLNRVRISMRRARFYIASASFAAEGAGADQVPSGAGPAVPHIRRQDSERRGVAGRPEHQGRLHGASGDQDAAEAGARGGPAPSAG